MQVRNYENSEGRKVYVTEVVADNIRFLESASASKEPERSNPPPLLPDIDISDDDLPF